MCIIVFKPRKVPMPSLEIIENCFKNNPNGAGFMYRHEKKIHISKGYMTLDALCNALNLVNEVVDLRKTDVTLHFRISTTGSTIPQNCHPFPLSNNVEDLKALNIVVDRAIAHNGILQSYAGYHNTETDMSDTMYFAKMLSGVNDKFIAPVIDSHTTTGSRFVYMSGAGKSHTFGLYKRKGCGLWYSNESYTPPVVTIYDYPKSWYGGVDALDREEAWQAWAAKNGHKKQTAITTTSSPALTEDDIKFLQEELMIEAEEEAERNRLTRLDRQKVLASANAKNALKVPRDWKDGYKERLEFVNYLEGGY